MDYLSFLTPCGKYIILWKSNIRKADVVENCNRYIQGAQTKLNKTAKNQQLQ